LTAAAVTAAECKCLIERHSRAAACLNAARVPSTATAAKEDVEMERSAVRRAAPMAVLAVLACQLLIGFRAEAAPGDAIADVTIAEPYPEIVAPSVAFDGRYLYHTGYGGSVLHRIDVPPAGTPSAASGQVDVPITGAPSGIMTLTYDAGRAAFWAVGGDGVSIYGLTRAGMSTLVFTVDPDTDRPGF